MSCLHCGERLLHKRDGVLHCCGCGRARLDLGRAQPLLSLWRHGPVLLIGLVCLPLALGMAMLEEVRVPGSAQAPVQGR